MRQPEPQLLPPIPQKKWLNPNTDEENFEITRLNILLPHLLGGKNFASRDV